MNLQRHGMAGRIAGLLAAAVLATAGLAFAQGTPKHKQKMSKASTATASHRQMKPKARGARIVATHRPALPQAKAPAVHVMGMTPHRPLMPKGVGLAPAGAAPAPH